MPARKPRKGICTRSFQKLDMFSSHIGFNMNGEKKHKTIFGAFYSLFIAAWVGVVLNYLIQQIVIDDLDRLPTVINRANYYGGVPLTSEDGFYFAIGISTPKGYYVLEDQSNWSITEQYVTITAELQPSENYMEGMPQSFELQRCTDKLWENLYPPAPEYTQMVEQHRLALQFYCPNPSAQFLNLTNRYDNTLRNSVINLYVSKCDQTNPTCKSDTPRRNFFDGKGILLLLNSEFIDGNEGKVEKPAKQSVPHWLSLNMDQAETTRIVLQRYRFINDDFKARHNLEYWSVIKDKGHWDKELYAFSRSKKNVYAQI